MAVIVMYIYLQKDFFCETFLYRQKAKNPNHFYIRSIFLNPKYRELSWATKMEFYIFEKSNNSLATKLWVNLLNNGFFIFLVQDTIQWKCFVVHYLNMKMKEKSVEKIGLEICS